MARIANDRHLRFAAATTMVAGLSFKGHMNRGPML